MCVETEPPSRPRLVVLGASNLTRLLPTLVAHARARAGGAVDVRGAIGFGRSYGVRSHFLCRALPGIDGCGLWPALATAPPAPATGIVADVGNDVLYGFDVPQIVAWVERALERLRPYVDELVVAGLPAHELARVGPLRYGLVRTLLVPSCRVPRLEALRRAERLHAALEERAARHGARFVPMREGWYGLDPIHVRRRCHDAFAAALLGTDGTPARAALRTLDRLRIVTARAAVRRICGVELTRPQPSRRLADGTSIALY